MRISSLIGLANGPVGARARVGMGVELRGQRGGDRGSWYKSKLD
jgi:hypothetical protein